MLAIPPQQPVSYSHALHAGQLGLDCRYCHTTVEDTAFASVPPTSVCMNCHALIAATSEKLVAVRESAASGNPVHWVQVHDLPNYVYFDHQRTRDSRRGLRLMPRPGRYDGAGVAGRAVEHGLVFGVPPPPRTLPAATRVRHSHGLDAQ